MAHIMYRVATLVFFYFYILDHQAVGPCFVGILVICFDHGFILVQYH